MEAEATEESGGAISALRQEKNSTVKMADKSHVDLNVFIRVKYYVD
jgi:hypothetical protein